MNKMKFDRKGLFIVADGLDGIGKGEIERALIGYEQKLGRAVFDVISFSRANRKGLPELKDFWNPPYTYYDTIINAEPSYIGVGQIIRDEIISKNKRDYSFIDEIEAYSLDRLVNMKRIVIPALINGVNVIQSRCVAATLNYQALKAKEKGISLEKIRKKILSYEGNRLQFTWAPDLLIIPTINDMNELEKRLKSRAETNKDDNTIHDNINFQTKLKPLFEDAWLKILFEEYGTKVEYLDAGISEHETRNQAIKIYKKFLESKN